ncbi:sugar nucleotide-binding protein [bacterium]|nr:sugar nucleotide-binding protein [bacterium]
MRITITGGTGKLGASLHEVLKAQHDVTVFDLDLDITNFQVLHTTIQKARPDLVINTAAWTDVDGCAREPEKRF